MSIATRVLASCTGPRSTGRLAVVASLMSLESSMSAASAVGPSIHGPAEEEMIVRAEVSETERRRRAGIGFERGQGPACCEVDQRQVGAVLHVIVHGQSEPSRASTAAQH